MWWLQFRSLLNSTFVKIKIKVTAISLYVSCLRVVGQGGTIGDDLVSGFLPRTLIGNKQDLSACCLTGAAAAKTVYLKLW